jgi:hypothetical protein
MSHQLQSHRVPLERRRLSCRTFAKNSETGILVQDANLLLPGVCQFHTQLIRNPNNALVRPMSITH